MEAEIAALEEDLKQSKLQLEQVTAQLQNDPENSGLQSLKVELEGLIDLSESTIAELKPASAPATTQKPSPPPVAEKWSRENHPAYQAGYRKPEPEEGAPIQTSFTVNETVLAKWRSGDGGFYTARITAVTGSKQNPVYTVKFQKYNTTENLSAKDVKPLSIEARKRKADGVSGSSTPNITTQPPVNTGVISAAANVDPTLAQQAKKDPSKVSDGPTRPAKIPRKVKANKELEAGKSKWQDFAAKSKTGKNSNKKDSMFRTGEGVHARGNFHTSDSLRLILT